MFDVDKVVSKFISNTDGKQKVVDDLTNVAIGHHWIVAIDSDTSVERWMVIKDSRLRFGFNVGTTEATGVSQLQPHHQIIGRLQYFAMCTEKSVSQFSQFALVRFSHQELIWIRAT